MTATELNLIKKSFIEGMKKNFERDGELLGMGVLIGENGTIDFIPALYQSDEEKLKWVVAVKALCNLRPISAIIIITEMWFVMRSADADMEEENKKIMATGNVRSQPDRIEGAILIF